MDISFMVKLTDGAITCSGSVNSDQVSDKSTINTIAIGMLEIAKASLLAKRWGIDIIDVSKNAVRKDDQE